MPLKIDAAKSAGALLGTDVAQLIVASLQYFLHMPVSDVVAGSITGICIWIFSHAIPNQSGPTAPEGK